MHPLKRRASGAGSGLWLFLWLSVGVGLRRNLGVYPPALRAPPLERGAKERGEFLFVGADA
jgi:hypothetical protein